MKVLDFKKKPKLTPTDEGFEDTSLYPEKIRTALSKYGSNQGNVKKYNKKDEEV
jgi:hypothetical protein